MISNFDKFCISIFGENENPNKVFKCMAHHLYSREKNIQESIREYNNFITFLNNENYPSIVIHDEVEETDKTTLFYLVDDLNEIPSIIKKNKIFIDNLKENIINKEDRNLWPNFFNTLEKIKENKAFNFEIVILINEIIRDQEIVKVEKQYSSDPNILNIGDLKIIDKKRLINKWEGENEDEEDIAGSVNFNFEFKNPSNSDTGLNNAIIYEERNSEKTILLSIQALSLVACYDRFQDRIFEKNVRYNINTGTASQNVDKSIKETVENNPEKFFIFNNGITVVAEKIDDLDTINNTVKLTNFSIVNGAQTVTNLKKIAKDNKLKDKLNNVYVVAKIIEISKNGDKDLVDQITKSSNNQKPVQARDFRSNSSEMISLKRYFMENNVILNIKRGDNDIKEKKYIINNSKINENEIPRVLNDKLGQYIYSLILMKPTVALQNKGKIFNDEHYDLVFKNKKISHDDILLAYKFYVYAEKSLQKANSDVNFERYQELKPLIGVTQNWIISLLWFIWNNSNKLDKLVKIDKIDDFKNANQTFIEKTNNDYIKINTKLLSKFLLTIYSELKKIYQEERNQKNEMYGHSAFSYRKEFFNKFVKLCLIPEVTFEENLKIQELKNIFSI